MTLGNTPTSVGKTPVLSIKFPVYPETPPRAWGRHGTKSPNAGDSGNTPTSVGKTVGYRRDRACCWKHPHERGEDSWDASEIGSCSETPPRAWGRRPSRAGGSSERRKHPHERGEDLTMAARVQRKLETPPRAWGRQPGKGGFKSQLGNTPTSVGKTRMD